MMPELADVLGAHASRGLGAREYLGARWPICWPIIITRVLIPCPSWGERAPLNDDWLIGHLGAPESALEPLPAPTLALSWTWPHRRSNAFRGAPEFRAHQYLHACHALDAVAICLQKYSLRCIVCLSEHKNDGNTSDDQAPQCLPRRSLRCQRSQASHL
jgi:hypothetical protein